MGGTKKFFYKLYFKLYFTVAVISLIAFGLAHWYLYCFHYFPVYAMAEVVVTQKEEVKTTPIRTLRLYTPKEVKQRVIDIAKERNIDYLDYLLRLVACETGGTFNQFAINGRNSNGTKDLGVTQINDCHKIPEYKRFDVDFTINWTIDKINAGGQGIWVCDGLIKSNPEKYRNQYNKL